MSWDEAQRSLMVGTNARDVLAGGGGSDTLIGGAGENLIHGGLGNRIEGEPASAGTCWPAMTETTSANRDDFLLAA
ncbi:MAG TPA: hypothetical protein PKE27_15470 [Povalibacter sp.]|uniref:hypothetical protein n=1 Tax=Povalibacter sp. TaxID=1962978 RepID=UPI002C96FFBF|nr:hypothetical protein [Povalibacter sp.]HMN45976.1 hypothetical protein [Povalibacter sp.]